MPLMRQRSRNAVSGLGSSSICYVEDGIGEMVVVGTFIPQNYHCVAVTTSELKRPSFVARQTSLAIELLLHSCFY